MLSSPVSHFALSLLSCALASAAAPLARASQPASTAAPAPITAPASIADDAPWDELKRTWGLSLGGGIVGLARDRPMGAKAVAAAWLHGTWSPFVTGTGRRFRFDVRLGATVGGFPLGHGGLFGVDVLACMEFRITRGHGVEYCPFGLAYDAQVKSQTTTGIGYTTNLGWRWHPERAPFRTLRVSTAITMGGVRTGPAAPAPAAATPVDAFSFAALSFEIGLEW